MGEVSSRARASVVRGSAKMDGNGDVETEMKRRRTVYLECSRDSG